jgi:hypothetical protein
MTHCTAFIGLDTHKKTIAAAVADDGRDGEVRFYGNIANEPAAVAKWINKLAERYDRLTWQHRTGCVWGSSMHAWMGRPGTPSRGPRPCTTGGKRR